MKKPLRLLQRKLLNNSNKYYGTFRRDVPFIFLCKKTAFCFIAEGCLMLILFKVIFFDVFLDFLNRIKEGTDGSVMVKSVNNKSDIL